MQTARFSTRMAAIIVLACAFTLLLGYLNKARCTEGPVRADGRTEQFDAIKDKDVCYSDIQLLWLGRDINNHTFPYLSGGITEDGRMTGGSVEYPVLTGVLMWAGAYYATTDGEFLLQTALLLAPFALLTAWLLGRMAGRAAFLWAIGPPLVLYAFHNWELPVVLSSVAAIYLMTLPVGLRPRAYAAAAVLALGFCLKIYPGLFVLPLLIHVFTGGRRGAELDPEVRGRFDVVGAINTAGIAAATVIGVNLPFALGNFEGWVASFEFQRDRLADITTNAVWYWGYQLWTGSLATDNTHYQDLVSLASPACILGSFAVAIGAGVWKYVRTGTFDWVSVSAAMLCGFMMFHKVNSPQYALWVIPFFVLIRVPWTLIAAYIVANAAIGIGVFRYFYALSHNLPYTVQENVVMGAVLIQFALIGCLFVAFLVCGSRISGAPSSTPPTGSSIPADRTRSSVGR